MESVRASQLLQKETNLKHETFSTQRFCLGLSESKKPELCKSDGHGTFFFLSGRELLYIRAVISRGKERAILLPFLSSTTA